MAKHAQPKEEPVRKIPRKRYERCANLCPRTEVYDLQGKHTCKLCAQIALAEWNNMVHDVNKQMGGGT